MNSIHVGRSSLVVFDLDKTITKRDTFLDFIWQFFKAHKRVTWNIVPLPFYCALYLVGKVSDRTFKQAFLKAFISGFPVKELDEFCNEFATHTLETNTRPKIRSEIDKHQRRNARIIIVSASPIFYVLPIATALGIKEVLATNIQTHNGCYTGEILGENCKGQEKVRRLTEYLGSDQTMYHKRIAYGDHESDMFILRWADIGYLVKRDFLEQVGVAEGTNGTSAI